MGAGADNDIFKGNSKLRPRKQKERLKMIQR